MPGRSLGESLSAQPPPLVADGTASWSTMEVDLGDATRSQWQGGQGSVLEGKDLQPTRHLPEPALSVGSYLGVTEISEEDICVQGVLSLLGRRGKGIG